LNYYADLRRFSNIQVIIVLVANLCEFGFINDL